MVILNIFNCSSYSKEFELSFFFTTALTKIISYHDRTGAQIIGHHVPENSTDSSGQYFSDCHNVRLVIFTNATTEIMCFYLIYLIFNSKLDKINLS